MTTSPLVTLSNPDDLLAVLPHLIGFQPSASTLAVAVNGSHLGMVARVDTPAEDDVEAMVATVVPALLREKPAGVFVLGYETVTGDAETATNALAAALIADGTTVVDVILVSDGCWRHLGRTETHPAPSPEHPTGLELRVANGSTPAPTRAALAARVAATPRAVAVDAECTKIGDEGPQSSAEVARAWGEVLTAQESIAELPDRVLAVASLGLTSESGTALRDALLAHVCPGLVPLDGLDATTIAAVQAGIALPWGTTVPETQQLVRLLARLVETCSSLPETRVVPALTMLAGVAWWKGDGALARVALERALAVDPNHRLALLIDQMLDLGIRAPH